MKINKAILLRHVLIWAIYISYELSLIQLTVGLNASVSHYTFFYLLNICLFYFNAHVILDYAFFKTDQPFLISICLIALEIIAYLFLKLQFDSYFSGASLNLDMNVANERIWLTNIFREIFFIGFSIAYWSMLYMVRFKEKNHRMEKEQLRSMARTLELENKYISAENAYLQNQISPHLLFNSLNFIYNAIHKLSDRAGKGVMLLSEIMRYSLLSSEDNRTVLLTEEVEQLQKLLDLSYLRFEQQLHIKFRKKGKLKGIRILPLILITLVENMIKHGDLGDAKVPGQILLSYTDGLLLFVTRNKKRPSSPHPAGGLGLRSVEKRLANYYANQYQLDISEENNIFTVSLALNL